MPLSFQKAAHTEGKAQATQVGQHEKRGDDMVLRACDARYLEDTEVFLEKAAALYGSFAGDSLACAIKQGWALDALHDTSSEKAIARGRARMLGKASPAALVAAYLGTYATGGIGMAYRLDRDLASILAEAPTDKLSDVELRNAVISSTAHGDSLLVRATLMGTKADVGALHRWLPSKPWRCDQANMAMQRLLHLAASTPRDAWANMSRLADKAELLLRLEATVREPAQLVTLANLAAYQSDVHGSLWRRFDHDQFSPQTLFGGNTLVQVALQRYAQFPKVKLEYALKQGGSLTDYPAGTESPLQLALKHGLAQVDMLLSLGFDINELDSHTGDGLLHLALRCNLSAHILPLLLKGADAALTDAHGCTLAQRAEAAGDRHLCATLKSYAELQPAMGKVRAYVERCPVRYALVFVVRRLLDSAKPIDAAALEATVDLWWVLPVNYIHDQDWLASTAAYVTSVQPGAQRQQALVTLRAAGHEATVATLTRRLPGVAFEFLAPLGRLLAAVERSWGKRRSPSGNMCQIARLFFDNLHLGLIKVQTLTELFVDLPLRKLAEIHTYQILTAVYQQHGLPALLRFCSAVRFFAAAKAAAAATAAKEKKPKTIISLLVSEAEVLECAKRALGKPLVLPGEGDGVWQTRSKKDPAVIHEADWALWQPTGVAPNLALYESNRDPSVVTQSAVAYGATADFSKTLPQLEADDGAKGTEPTQHAAADAADAADAANEATAFASSPLLPETHLRAMPTYEESADAWVKRICQGRHGFSSKGLEPLLEAAQRLQDYQVTGLAHHEVGWGDDDDAKTITILHAALMHNNGRLAVVGDKTYGRFHRQAETRRDAARLLLLIMESIFGSDARTVMFDPSSRARTIRKRQFIWSPDTAANRREGRYNAFAEAMFRVINGANGLLAEHPSFPEDLCKAAADS